LGKYGDKRAGGEVTKKRNAFRQEVRGKGGAEKKKPERKSSKKICEGTKGKRIRGKVPSTKVIEESLRHFTDGGGEKKKEKDSERGEFKWGLLKAKRATRK